MKLPDFPEILNSMTTWRSQDQCGRCVIRFKNYVSYQTSYPLLHYVTSSDTNMARNQKSLLAQRGGYKRVMASHARLT